MSTSPARLLSAIAGRSGAASVVAGPPGAGKSALLDDLERRARAAGWRARRAAHAPNRRFVPYGALRDLFDPHPAALDSPGRPIAETALELGAHCAALAGNAPVALLVDDAQWSDRGSLKVLAHLARRTGDLPLLVVLATRPRTGHEPDVATIFGAIEGVAAIRVQRADRPAAA